MSAVRDVWVTCDGGCGESSFGGGESPATTVKQAREAARAIGWSTGLPGRRDLCPECREASR